MSAPGSDLWAPDRCRGLRRHLIGGVCLQIGRYLPDGRAGQLPDLLSDLLGEYLLVYHLGPGGRRTSI